MEPHEVPAPIPHAPDTEPLPQLVPDTRWPLSAKVGIITGAVLLALTAALMTYGIIGMTTGGW